MGKVETILKSEIIRLSKREVRKNFTPLRRDVRQLRASLSQLRKTLTEIQRFTSRQGKALRTDGIPLEASVEEVKASRFSPRLIRSLRKRLGVTQKEMASLAGVTVGAIYQWEKGIFEPRGDKRKVIVALRKLGRRDVKTLLEGKKAEGAEKKVRTRRRGKTRRASRK